MIGKTSIGRSFKGCCAYNLQKVEMGKGEILMSQGVRDYELGAMVADFVRQASMNPDLSRSVWHTAVSFDPTDEARLRADPQLMQKVASAYLTGMGLDQSQYVVIRHTDTAHAHFHIVANRVANDGQTVSDGHNYSRSEKLLRQIEQTYQLTPMQEQAQRQNLENLPNRDRSRIEMRDQVRESLSRSANDDELRKNLATHHITMIVNQNKAGQSRGYTFEQVKAQENGEETRIAFKGSKLHQNLGMSQIQEQLDLNAQLRQKHAIEIDREKERVKAQEEEKSRQIEDKSLKRGYGRSM
jgi:hypothetical protein